METLVDLARALMPSLSESVKTLRFDRFIWTVFSKLEDIVREKRSSSSTSSSRKHQRIVQDFFQLTIEDFIGRYYGRLCQIDVNNRKLVLAVKYKLSFALDVKSPDNDSFRPSTTYFTVATLVPCVGEDYRKLLTGSPFKCTCKKPTKDCQYCMRYDRGTAFDPPNPYSWVKSQESTTCELLDGRDSGGVNNVLTYFREQTIQTNLNDAARRFKLRDLEGTCRTNRSTASVHVVEKFATSELPSTLRFENFDSGLSAYDPAFSERWEYDLNSLLNHFSISWAKLHYLEPNIVPQYGD
jgi:hypothetical protein